MKEMCVGRALVVAACVAARPRLFSLQSSMRCDLDDIFHAVDDLTGGTTFSTPWTIYSSG